MCARNFVTSIERHWKWNSLKLWENALQNDLKMPRVTVCKANKPPPSDTFGMCWYNGAPLNTIRFSLSTSGPLNPTGLNLSDGGPLTPLGWVGVMELSWTPMGWAGDPLTWLGWVMELHWTPMGWVGVLLWSKPLWWGSNPNIQTTQKWRGCKGGSNFLLKPLFWTSRCLDLSVALLSHHTHYATERRPQNLWANTQQHTHTQVHTNVDLSQQVMVSTSSSPWSSFSPSLRQTWVFHRLFLSPVYSSFYCQHWVYLL